MCRAHPHLMLPLTTTAKDKLINIHISLQKPLEDWEPCGHPCCLSQVWDKSGMTLKVSLSQTFEAYSIGLHLYLIFLSMSVFFHWKRPKETENERALFSLTLPHQLSSSENSFPFLLLIQRVKVSVEGWRKSITQQVFYSCKWSMKHCCYDLKSCTYGLQLKFSWISWSRSWD